MRVLVFTRYNHFGASSRLRFYQYFNYLESSGFDITVAPLFYDGYVVDLYNGKVSIWRVLQSYVKRLSFILRTGRFDLVWIEKEMLPWVPAWIELGLFPANFHLVVDYDDAVFHRYDQHHLSIVRRLLSRKIDAVMRRADLVIVGNDYIGERARQAGARRIELLPTVIDASRYIVSSDATGQRLTIGWVGSPSTAHYLKLIAPALQELTISRGVRVVAVGANPTQLQNLPIEVRTWSEETEAIEIQQFDIGIMPLPDRDFERGKCGYKLIQYMACGKPVVASPVGVNAVIVRPGNDGFLATTVAEWSELLRILCDDSLLRQRMGAAGRARIESEYSLQVTAPKLEQVLRTIGKNKEENRCAVLPVL